MKLLGIVAEYNPFHKGHRYQAARAREQSGADVVAAVMSGGFVQRGEAAVCGKWARAEMALSGGVDLVVELPVVYAAQAAEFFAAGAVGILNAMGADYISFGSECGDLSLLWRAARLLEDEPEEYRRALANALAQGHSIPVARGRAGAQMGISSVLSCPNSTLGVEYLRAILRQGAPIQPIVVRRRGPEHDGYGSAAYIRTLAPGEAGEHLPPESYAVYLREVRSKKAPLRMEAIETAVLARLRSISPEELSRISGVSEGLEHRIRRAAQSADGLDSLLAQCKTRRYTMARLRRITVNTLLGITRQDVAAPPEYVRVLGMNERGREALRRIKERASLPVITKTARAPAGRMLELDLLATDIHMLMCPGREHRGGRQDFYTAPVVAGER